MKTSDERINSIKNKVNSRRRQRAIVWTSTVTACVLVALTVVCSLPILGNDVPPINTYVEDDYYPLIEKINERYTSNKYSIFQLGTVVGNWGAVGDDAAVVQPEIAPPTSSVDSTSPAPGVSEANNSSGSSNKYEENTLNQVDGVKEGDLLKRSKTHAFYLKNVYAKNSEQCLLLQVYKLAGNETEVVAEHYIRAKDETSFCKDYWHINGEMFLSVDATRLTVISSCLSKQNVIYTTIISLDVSDVENITEVNRVYVSGSYSSSRIVEGKLLVITNFYLNFYGYNNDGIDYSEKEKYVPQCGSTLNDFIPMRNIYVPDYCECRYYTVMAMLDETTLEVNDSYAIFTSSQDVYVSRDYLVVMRNRYRYYYDQVEQDNEITRDKFSGAKQTITAHMSEIMAVKYGDSFEMKGKIDFDGSIKDRYSMDEKDGVLRVFVTLRHSSIVADSWSSYTNVSLYCVNLDKMQVVASKVCFAPSGDEVKSARFDGDKAYVCTARLNTDPVFYFDLSDLNNITYVDTGEIEGFSVNLIKFNDLLLGIGQGENSFTLKVEMYNESDDPEAENGVVGVAKYEYNCRFSKEYKAQFINAEHNLIGLHIYDHTSTLVTNNPNINRNKYLLLRYDAETKSFVQIYLEEFDSASDYVRAFYEHDGVYVFGTNAFTFIDLQQDNA